MINNFKALLSKVLSPKGDDIIVNMDGGVGGSWRLGSEEIECAIDEKVVDCGEMDNPPYIGVPAPAYLEDDPWFGPAPTLTEKQQDYMEQETFIKQQQHQETHSVESEDREVPRGPAETRNIQLFSNIGNPSEVYSGPVPLGTVVIIFSYLSLSFNGML